MKLITDNLSGILPNSVISVFWTDRAGNVDPVFLFRRAGNTSPTDARGQSFAGKPTFR